MILDLNNIDFDNNLPFRNNFRRFSTDYRCTSWN